MNTITIWHNPRCSKSREALQILQESNSKIEVVKYLQSNPSKKEIQEILSKLDLSARELMREKEDIYKELNLKDELDEEKLIEAMVEYPKLIERPVLIKGDKAIIGRPTSKIAEFLG